MYLSVQESIFFTKFPSKCLLPGQVSTYRRSFIFINFYHHFQNAKNCPFCPYPFRCLYRNKESCPNVLCPFRCLYIDMPFFRENAFLTQNFTQDRRPNGRLLAPTPLTLRGEDLLRKSKDALLRIAKNSTCYAR